MNKPLFAVSVCLAWAGAALSTASVAHAVAVTPQAGSYASCSSSSQSTMMMTWCGGYVTNYGQVIKFINVACNAGACSGNDTTFTEFPYTAGRQVATLRYSCGYNVYDLGSCAC